MAWWLRDGAQAVEPAQPRATSAIAPEATPPRDVVAQVAPSAAPATGVTRDAVLAEEADLPAASATVRLTGRTLDGFGAPLADVELFLLHDEGDDARATTTSDDSGTFVFEVADAGARDGSLPWRVHAQREGYVPLDERRPGPELGDLTLVQRPVISGLLVLPDGSPAAPPGDVQFDVLLPSGEREGCKAEIDERGRFTTSELVPGRLDRSRVRVRGFGLEERRHDLVLEPGSHHELTLAVPAGGTVRGRVVDAASEAPVPFAEVWADQWTYHPDSVEPSTVADAEGRFELHGVELHGLEGQGDLSKFAWVQVSARAEGYRGHPFEASVVHLTDDGAYEGLTVEIERADASVHGRITWPDGSPAQGVVVYGLDDGPNLHFEATDGDGRFEFDGLKPGPMTICARTDSERSPGRQGRVDARVELESGAQETLELVLGIADGHIAGRVVDGDGAPLAGVEVEAGEHVVAGGLTMGVGQRRTTTDVDGRYVLEGLGPGRYQVEISAPERGARAARPSHVDVDLEPDLPREDVDFELVPGAEYSGWVEVGEDDPRGYRVERRRLEDDEHLDRMEPDGEGRFRFTACWPEPCALVLVRDGQHLARVEVGAGGAAGVVLTAPR